MFPPAARPPHSPARARARPRRRLRDKEPPLDQRRVEAPGRQAWTTAAAGWPLKARGMRDSSRVPARAAFVGEYPKASAQHKAPSAKISAAPRRASPIWGCQSSGALYDSVQCSAAKSWTARQSRRSRRGAPNEEQLPRSTRTHDELCWRTLSESPCAYFAAWHSARASPTATRMDAVICGRRHVLVDNVSSRSFRTEAPYNGKASLYTFLSTP